MECTRIREIISEYIDDTLDAEVRAAVDEHISTCKGCQEELAKLGALVDELGSLEPVKAPGDLLEKIHERLELGYGFHRIVRKLFVPFRIKIPLELAGAAIVAVLVVAVFLNIQQTEKKIVKIPEVSTHERGALKPPVDHLGPSLKQEAKKESAAPEEPKAGESVRESESIELVLVFKKVFKKEVTATTRTSGMAMKSALPTERDRSAEEEKREVVSRQGDSVKHLIGLVNGKVLAVKYDSQTGRLTYIHAEIPANRYKTLKEGLIRLGTLRTTPPALSEKGRETVHIRINLKSSE